MDKEIEICCNCKWWDRANEINVKRLNPVGKNAPTTMAALCLYKDAPPLHDYLRERNVYTSFLDCCSMFVLVDGYNIATQVKKENVIREGSELSRQCDMCEEIKEKVIFLAEDRLCKDCLKKALEMLE